MRRCLTLDRKLHRLLWMQQKNWAPDVTIRFELSVEPISYHHEAAFSQSGTPVFSPVPITLCQCCLL
jgi:hypothetical protein